MRAGWISEVFAESSGTGDSGKEDFELANAFQDNDIAAAALKALSKTGNHPIGEKAPVTGSPDEQGSAAEATGANTLFAALGLVILVILVFGAVVAMIISRKR